jgi:hypothetical protein
MSSPPSLFCHIENNLVERALHKCNASRRQHLGLDSDYPLPNARARRTCLYYCFSPTAPLTMSHAATYHSCDSCVRVDIITRSIVAALWTNFDLAQTGIVRYYIQIFRALRYNVHRPYY